MKIEMRVRDGKVMAEDLTDPPEALLQGARCTDTASTP
jgi:hypothetical protein